MLRRKYVLLGLLLVAVCAYAPFAVESANSTPTWAGLEPAVSVSSSPISLDCYTRCENNVCVSFPFTWTCDDSGASCVNIKHCIG